MSTTGQKLETKDLDKEIAAMKDEVRRLETEQAELENAAPLTWDEIRAGATVELEAKERRRSILPTLIRSAKVKKLELARTKYERAMEPLEKQQLEAYERSEKIQGKLYKLQDELTEARQYHHDATWRLDGYRRRVKEVNRQIAELRGGKHER